MGRLGFFLSVIMISVIVASLVVNIHFYRVAGQLTQLISPLRVSIDEINSDPSAWVNRTVVVEGKLWGPLVFAGIGVPPPWNYKLFRPNATQKSEKVFIGARWTGIDEYSFEKAIVVGVIKEGYWSPNFSGGQVHHYIEVQKIVRL